MFEKIIVVINCHVKFQKSNGLKPKESAFTVFMSLLNGFCQLRLKWWMEGIDKTERGQRLKEHFPSGRYIFKWRNICILMPLIAAKGWRTDKIVLIVFRNAFKRCVIFSRNDLFRNFLDSAFLLIILYWLGLAACYEWATRHFGTHRHRNQFTLSLWLNHKRHAKQFRFEHGFGVIFP